MNATFCAVQSVGRRLSVETEKKRPAPTLHTGAGEESYNAA